MTTPKKQLFKRCPVCDTPNPIRSDGKTAPACFHCGHEFYRETFSDLTEHLERLRAETNNPDARIALSDVKFLLDRAYRIGAHDMWDYIIDKDYQKLCDEKEKDKS